MRRVQPMICRIDPMKDGGFWAPGPASTPPPQTLLLEFQLPVCIVKRNFFFAEGSVQSERNVDHCGIVRMKP